MTDWKPGDLALCVRDNWANDGDAGLGHSVPLIGKCSLHVVTAFVVRDRDYPQFSDQLSNAEYLTFDARHRFGYRADWFHKINPLTDEEREQFAADLREPVDA